MNWSEYQKNIFKWVKSGTGHGQVVAVAGASKTTSAVECVNHIDFMARKRFGAFNKSNRDELASRIGRRCEVVNFNGFGWKMCLQGLGKIEFDEHKTWYTLSMMVDQGTYFKCRGVVKRIVSLLKGECVKERIVERIWDIAEYHGMEVTDKLVELTNRVYKTCIENTKVMDYDDQLFMPIYLDLPITQTDFLIIDEAQDMNFVQTELMLRSCVHGRIMFIGDPEQAIYGFRGATPDNMRLMAERLNATSLPLYICYRCPKAVVAEAKKFVSHIEPWSEAAEGVVRRIGSAEFFKKCGPKDYVLCRLTEPLVRACLEFIRAGRQGYVKGRDIGEGLIALIDKMKSDELIKMLGELNDYKIRTCAIYAAQNKEREQQTLADKCETIGVLSEGLQTIDELRSRIGVVFPERGTGTCFMTIHKAKGFETARVFVIGSKPIKPRTDWQVEEERRLKYVCVTRAKEELYYVD